MSDDILAMFIPITSVLVIGVVFVALFYFRSKNRMQLQLTVREAISKGNELTPELIDRLAGPRPGPSHDLRRAFVWLAVGIACALFGVIVDEDDAVRPLLAIGMFPMLVGVAYLLMWKFARQDA